MLQTNSKTGFDREVRREMHFKSSQSTETLKDLPRPYYDVITKNRGFCLLPTFSGQLVEIKPKRTTTNTWYYGEIVCSPKPNNNSFPNRGMFPAVLCKPAKMSQVLNASPTWEVGKSGLVTVPSHSPEYHSVESAFRTSLYNPSMVLGVERVQDLQQWKLYRVKLESLIDHYKDPNRLFNNSQLNLEMKHLYHGTDAKTAHKIVSQGFNRAFAGRNGTSYGKGTYFAIHAWYSNRFTHSDEYGVRKMFMCRVAVGDWCLGQSHMVVPNDKPGTTNELFDSTVDDASNPSIFVVYHDAQAYPEYLITYVNTV